MNQSSSSVNVVIVGALGRMGSQAVGAVLAADGLELVGAVARRQAGEDVALATGGQAPCGVEIQTNLASVLADRKPEVVIDLTRPDCVFANALAIIDAGARPVIGATGLDNAQLGQLAQAVQTKGTSGIYVPNFSIGAVLMMQFAAQASLYFDHAEITETHHNQKKDAPSGTAIRTAELMEQKRPQFAIDNLADEVETLPGSRGGRRPSGIRIHSLRLPGAVAHQEVVFGDTGQLLTIRHDALDRSCFMPGVVHAARTIGSKRGFFVGLEHLL